jgi:hypothetical protein
VLSCDVRVASDWNRKPENRKAEVNFDVGRRVSAASPGAAPETRVLAQGSNVQKQVRLGKHVFHLAQQAALGLVVHLESLIKLL